MTERELFLKNIPGIAEIAVECRKMNTEEYEAFKGEWLSATPEAAKDFASKVLIVVDTVINRKEAA